jgi:hypothetical protein
MCGAPVMTDRLSRSNAGRVLDDGAEYVAHGPVALVLDELAQGRLGSLELPGVLLLRDGIPECMSA